MKEKTEKKKWMIAEKNLDESKDWLDNPEGHEKLARILLRASLTYDEDCQDDKGVLEDVGMALGLLHPVNVYHACSDLVREGAGQIVHRFFKEEEFTDSDEKVATCKAVGKATEAVCNLITQTDYWNAKEVSVCLEKTAKLLDEKRMIDDLSGNDESDGVVFRYNFVEGDVTIIEDEGDGEKSEDN